MKYSKELDITLLVPFVLHCISNARRGVPHAHYQIIRTIVYPEHKEICYLRHLKDLGFIALYSIKNKFISANKSFYTISGYEEQQGHPLLLDEEINRWGFEYCDDLFTYHYEIDKGVGCLISKIRLVYHKKGGNNREDLYINLQ